MSSVFITFEGIDGSGKSTQAKLFSKWCLEYLKKEVVLTREPGGSPSCQVFRDIVLEGKLRHPWSEPFIFMLDRAEHIADVIEPALNEGKIVICERYFDSTLAYQVWGRGLDRSVLDAMFKTAHFPVPDITIYFSIEVDAAFERVLRRGKLDSIESEGYIFMKKIKQGYDDLSKENPGRFVVIKTDGKTPQEVFEEVKDVLLTRGL